MRAAEAKQNMRKRRLCIIVATTNTTNNNRHKFRGSNVLTSMAPILTTAAAPFGRYHCLYMVGRLGW